MSQDAHVSDLLPAYALDCLDQDEMALVSEHLATCPSCRLELESYQAVTGELAFSVPEAVPPDHLKRQLLKQVQPERPTATADPESSWWRQLSSLWRRAAPAWGVISLALIVVLAVGNLMLRQQIDGSESGPEGFHIVSLSGTDLAPGATGTLVISGDGEYGTLIVDNDGKAAKARTIINTNVTEAVVGDVIVRNTGRLAIDTNQTLVVYGSWTNGGVLVAYSNAFVRFAGTNSVTVAGNSSSSWVRSSGDISSSSSRQVSLPRDERRAVWSVTDRNSNTSVACAVGNRRKIKLRSFSSRSLTRSATSIAGISDSTSFKVRYSFFSIASCRISMPST